MEGNELHVVRSWPWDTHCARLWTIEANGDARVVAEPRQTMSRHCRKLDPPGGHTLDDYYHCDCSRSGEKEAPMEAIARKYVSLDPGI